MKRLGILDYLVLLVIGLAGAWLFRGFLSPDPYYLQKGMIASVLLWALRIGIPILTIFILWLYAAIRRGNAPLAGIALVIASAVFALLVGYPPAQYFYERSYVSQIEKYHPYLQLRPHEIPSDLPRDRYLIMCLGGSTTEFADPDRGGWPGRLQKLLPSTIGGKPVRVINMGRQWYTTQHTLINYELNLRQAKPDVIILMQSVNDVLQNADFSYISHDAFRSDYGHFYGPVNRIIDRKGLLEFIAEMIGGLWGHTPRKLIVTKDFPGLPGYERNVRTLAELAKNDGTRLVFMSEPYLFKEQMTAEEQASLVLTNYEGLGRDRQWGPATGKYGMDTYNNKLKQIARDIGASFIDLEAAVPKTLEYFYDEVHYRVATFDLVASQVAKGLLEAGVVTGADTAPIR